MTSTMPERAFRFFDLEGKTLLITGVTSGIGRALLPGLFGQGLQLVFVGQEREKMAAICADLNVDRDRFRIYECDLSDPAAVEAVAQELVAEGLPIDAILHNAAIDPRHRFEQSDRLLWAHVLEVNVLSAVMLTRHLLPLLRKSAQGRLLFTGSVLNDMGGACATAYVASKGAVSGITRALAHELKGTGITVNCIVPGAIKVEKEMINDDGDRQIIDWQSIPRRLMPHDLLGLTCLLLSQLGGGITAQSITVDGGMLHPLACPEVQGRMLL